MKLKLMITLVVLALVFGMVLASCDDGEQIKISQGVDEIILDQYLLSAGGINDTDGVSANGESGYLANPYTDTDLLKAWQNQWYIGGAEIYYNGDDDTWYYSESFTPTSVVTWDHDGDGGTLTSTPEINLKGSDPSKAGAKQKNAGKGWKDYLESFISS